VTTPALDPTLGWALVLALAGMWTLACAHKLRDPGGFEAALAGYRLLPASGLRGVAWTLIAAEAGVAFALLLPASRGAAAWAGAALLALYSGAIAINLARGRRDFDCGCAARGAARPVGEGLLVRNAVLIGLSLAAALPPAPRSLAWLDGLTIGLGAGTLLLLHAGVEVALANAPRLRTPRRREWSTR
jgi:hypothetical protein